MNKISKTGIDISEQRFDDLDKEVIKFALENKIKNPSKKFADFGCGFGRVSVICSLLGYKGFLYDIKNFDKRFKKISEIFGFGGLDFAEGKIQDIPYSQFPNKLDFVLSQRTLHYLTYKDVKSFLKKAKKNLNKGGRIFLSFSGSESKLSEHYDISVKIEERFFKISKQNQEKFKITEPVCLYSKKEVEFLLESCGFKKVRVWKSSFGNIKAVFEKK